MSTRKSTILPDTIYGRLTLFCTVVEAIVVIILEAVIATVFQRNTRPSETSGTPVRGITVYLAIFCLAQVFSVILCWDALWHKNTIQIIGWVIFNIATFAYSIFQYIQMTDLFTTTNETIVNEITDRAALDNIRPALYVIPIILGVFQVVYFFLSWKLYQEFGWKIYKKIGADPRMKNMYRWYQIFLMLLKFDFFFAMGFSIQFLALVLAFNDPEFGITVAALPVAAIITALAVYGVRKEDKIFLGIFLFGLAGSMAYFVFKIWRTYNPQDAIRAAKYESTKKYMTFFAGITAVVVAMTFAVGVICWINFGKGLKQHLIASGKPSGNATNGTPNTEMQRKPIDA